MPCPEENVLNRLVLGQLADDEAETLARHLEECGRCVATVAAQGSDDTLVVAARVRDGAATPEPDAQEIATLIERLSGLFVAAPTHLFRPVGDEAASGGNDPHQGAAFETVLAPAQTEGELGRLGPYRVLKVLGAGGMGIVFEAEDPTLQRLVALKTLQPGIAAAPAARERFLREARAVAAVEDERIVPIYQVGEDRGIPFFAMQLLRGQTLEDRLRAAELASGARTLPVAEAVHIACETARALASAHGRGLVHRDIKPGNIFLETGARVRILDFGLARGIDDALALTQPGFVAGTPAYIAPEQRRGEAADARSDLFGLGCVLYRMLAGRTPLAGAATGAVEPLQSLNPETPAELADLTMELVASDPARRPSSALVVAHRLAAIAQELSSVSIAPPKVPPRLSWRRPGWRGVAAAAIAAGVVGLAVLAGVMLVRTPRGEFIIETDDADVAVMLGPAGGIALHDRQTGRSYVLAVGKHDLPTGEYQIDVREPDKLEFSTRRFTIKRGDATRVTVSLRPSKLAAFDAWLHETAALAAEQQLAAVSAKLRELNPGFDGAIGPRVADGKVVELQVLTDQLTDLRPLRALAALELLTCRGSESGKGRLMDLAPLKSLTKLVYVDFSANRVRDLTPLRGLPALNDLSCWANPIEDLRPLRGLPLRSLQLDHTFVTDADLESLQDLPLRKLYVRAPYAIHLGALAGLPLVHLYCDFRPERHPQTLRRIKSLQTINGTPSEDFWKAHDARRAGLEAWTKRIAAAPAEEQARAVTAKLRELNLGFEEHVNPKIEDGVVVSLSFPTDNVTDIAPVRALTKLRLLVLNGSRPRKGRLYDLDPIAGLPIGHLQFVNTEVADLSVLRGMKVQVLLCANTPVRDLTPVRTLPLFYLDCSGTRVQNIAPLKGMGITLLFLKGCRVTDFSPLAGRDFIRQLEADFEPARDTDVLRSIKRIETINGKAAAEFWKEFGK